MEVLTIKGNCKITGIGSLPFTDSKEAMEFVIDYCKDIPFWPQLPKRTHRENMYTMFSENIPGVRLNDYNSIYIDSNAEDEFEEFYQRILSGNNGGTILSDDYASGFFSFQKEIQTLSSKRAFKTLKGQVTGPISFGIQINDEKGKPVLYNDFLLDIVQKSICSYLQCQEVVLNKLADQAIIFIDEPYMAMIGSTIVNINPEKVTKMINSFCTETNCLIGIHCCANTDWSLILNSDIDILSFDAYEYAENFLLYTDEIAQFLEKEGIIAWGIIPTSAEGVEKESSGTLLKKMEHHLEKLKSKTGLTKEKILSSSLITPACGFGSRDIPTAKRAFELTLALSQKIQRKYELCEVD
jgi:methionine synthase II (cobalamin-independent)